MTDLSPPEHEPTASIGMAALWLVAQGEVTGRPIVPELKQRFGLTSGEACQACREAGLIKSRKP